jgi:2-polyprenyl-3-methyl-5-hydroxy-6-metoxy-1,4-benzoquinol methylase
MENIKDDRGYNQVWAETKSTRVRAQRRGDYMISQMAGGNEKSIMEIGCGIGSNCFYIAEKTGKKVLGTDLCQPFIDEANARYKLPNLRYDILDFNKAEQFKGETFDYIIGNGILHHLYHHLDSAFVNMHRLLSPGGKIIFLEPNIFNPYVYLIFSFAPLRKATHLEPDEMAFSKSFVTEKLLKAGFKNVKVEYKDFLLPGIPDALITPSVVIGDVLEKIPLLNKVSQSIFISAEK